MKTFIIYCIILGVICLLGIGWLLDFESGEVVVPVLEELEERLDHSWAVLNNDKIKMDDPRLIKAVRDLFVPPSMLPYSFRKNGLLNENADPSAGQTQLVQDILKSLGRNGFFIDCGANDGEWHSNTIWPERTLGWKGLLIEAEPTIFEALKRRNRNAWLGQFCLSINPYPSEMSFRGNGLGSRLEESKRAQSKIQCIPLYSVLLAINRTTIDYFSLDVEGAEMAVLQTVPFDKVVFKVITVETWGEQRVKDMIAFMESKGYIFYQSVHVYRKPKYLAQDCIFIHKSVKLTADQAARIGSHVEM